MQSRLNDFELYWLWSQYSIMQLIILLQAIFECIIQHQYITQNLQEKFSHDSFRPLKIH